MLCIGSVSKGIAEGRKWFKIAMKEACLVADVYVAAADFEAQQGLTENLGFSLQCLFKNPFQLN
jgi:hypothetical protein